MSTLLFALIFWVFGIFPKIAWREMNVRQATHPCQANFGFLEKNRLAAESRPPGDAMLKHISGFFLMHCLAVMNNHQATRVNSTRF